KAAARIPWIACVVRMSSYECGMDQPTYTPVQQIVERSGTLFFSFQDLDSTKPSGSAKIRVETITHYLEQNGASIISRKKAATRRGCPLVRRAQPGQGAGAARETGRELGGRRWGRPGSSARAARSRARTVRETR